jgi:hypothetical protein
MSKNNELNHGAAPAFIATGRQTKAVCPHCGLMSVRDQDGFRSCSFCLWDSYDCAICSDPRNGRYLPDCTSEGVGTHDCRGATVFLSPAADSIVRVVAALAAAIAIGAAIALWRL